MNPRVLFVGDVNLDIQMTGLKSPILIDREVFCDGLARTIGGSTAISACAYSTLGGGAAFSGLIGQDADGIYVTERLKETGLDLRYLRTTRETGTGVTVNIVRDSTRTQVTYPGTLAQVNEVDAVLGELREFAHLHVAGPYGTPRFMPEIARLLSAARAQGLSTSLDTQWGGDADWQFLDSWLPHLTWFFANEAEACAASGTESPEEAIEVLRWKTPCPIVKCGAKGALWAGGKVPSPRVEVVDSTGAGDSFVAGFLYATFEEKLEIAEALGFAAACGALACTYVGGVDSRLNDKNVRLILK